MNLLETVGQSPGLIFNLFQLNQKFRNRRNVELLLLTLAAVTLDDVVSRRLMLTFEPAFDGDTLRAIADALVATGRLTEEARDGEVARVAAGIERRHGRRLRERVTAG